MLLVGQAFMGTGLPPVVPYGTDVPVLQFNVTLNADMGVGSETGLTLLQDGTVNNVTQYTAVSDNEGALTWTPGMAPSNSGNAAVDGSVTVVPVTTPTASESIVAGTKPSVTVEPKVIVPVRRVTPVSQPVSTLESTTSVSITVSSLGGGGMVTETVTLTVNPVLTASAETSIVTAPVSISVSDSMASVQVPGLTSSLSRAADPAAISLSLAALATNKVAPSGTGTSNGKTSTSVLDDVYHLLGTMPAANGYLAVVGGEDTTGMVIDMWNLDGILDDLDSDTKSE